MRRIWNIVMAGMWTIAGLAMVFHETLMPQLSDTQARTGAIICGVMLLWNIVRWVIQRPPLKSVPPLRREEPAPYEYNPELDFQKLDREKRH